MGCDDLFTPAIENNKQVSDGLNDPLYAEGILANAYTRNPYSSQSFNDVATDDAVTNQTGDSFLKMATGGWTSANNNMEQWGTCKMAIQYLNLFLEQVGSVSFADDERRDEEQQRKAAERGDDKQTAQMLLQRGELQHEVVYPIQAAHPADEVGDVDQHRMRGGNIYGRHVPDQCTDQIDEKLRERLGSEHRDIRRHRP